MVIILIYNLYKIIGIVYLFHTKSSKSRVCFILIINLNIYICQPHFKGSQGSCSQQYHIESCRDRLLLITSAWTLLLLLLFLWCTLLSCISFLFSNLFFPFQHEGLTQSRRQELKRGGTASLSLCLLILMRVPFTVKP